MEVAERSLEARSFLICRRKQRLDQGHEISSRKGFLEVVNRTEPADLLTFNRKMRSRKNNCPRLRMARPEIADKVLSGHRSCVEIENEQLRFLLEHQILCFTQRPGDPGADPGHRLIQG